MASGYPALMIRPPESPLQQFAQVQQIKAEQQAMQLRAQQIESAQTANQSQNLDLQMKQTALKNMQTTQTALSDPKVWQDFNRWKGSPEGQDTNVTDPTSSTGSPVALHPIAKYLMDAKGLPLMGPGGAVELSQNFLKNEQDVANALKTKSEVTEKQLQNYDKKTTNLLERAEPILTDEDTDHQQMALKNLKIDAQMNPVAFPTSFVNNLNKINTVADLAPIVNTAKFSQMVIDAGKKKSEAQTAEMEATQKTRLASGVSAAALNDIKNTINTYTAMPPNMRTAFSQELDRAPDLETVQKIQTRADAAQESFQRTAEARQNALAMKDVGTQTKMADELAKQDIVLSGALNQSNGIRSLLDMSKGGNETAAAAAQTRFAEHEVVEGGVKRMNQIEFDKLTSSLGTYGRQFKAWYDKGMSPQQMPKATNAEMQAILDAEDQAAKNAHDGTVNAIQTRYSQIGGGGIPAPAPVMPKPTHRYNPQTGQIEAM